jgi:hypothetical protein
MCIVRQALRIRSWPSIGSMRCRSSMFQHPMLDDWRKNARGMTYIDKRNNLIVHGSVDDIWQMRDSGRPIVVDYKATAKNGEVTLDADWQLSYKRQMEVYIWLLRKQGFEVDDRGFFLYANGQEAEGFDEKIGFAISLLPYSGNTDWIEPTLTDLKDCLLAGAIPTAPDDCEFWGYIEANRKVVAGEALAYSRMLALRRKYCPRSNSPPFTIGHHYDL